MPPLVVVIAGPNGAGKSTSAPRLLQDALSVDEFVNADAIAAGISAFRPESVALEAARAMLTRIKLLARERRSFAFETTLASRSFAPWLKELREDGYRVYVTFLSLPNADLAVARVAERVRTGGHDVPEDVVRRRYVSGLGNFFAICRGIADAWQMFDNSDDVGPRLIAFGGREEPSVVRDREAWQSLFGATVMKPTSHEESMPVDRIHDIPRIEVALKLAVREALLWHKREGNPVAVWRNGQVVLLRPEDILADEIEMIR